MRAKKKAREDRFSIRRSYRFAPYFKRPVAETYESVMNMLPKVIGADTAQEKMKIK